MRILCDREKLREGLAVVNNVIPPKSTKPILENLCLIASADSLELLGTDLEVAVRYRIEDVKVEEPGTAVVPARVTLDFVRDLASETVSLETKDSTCTITGGTDECELVTVAADEYPVIPEFSGDKTISMQGGNFTKLVGNTAFAAAREAGRYAMHGVLVEIEEGLLRLVATDGRRLALATTPLDPELQSDKSIGPALVPTKGMQLFCRVIADPLDQIKLQFGENQVGLKTPNAEIFARLIDGDFPRYQGVIPAESENRLEADPALLTRKMRLVANVTGAEARAVRLRAKGEELELFGQSVGRGEAKAQMGIAYKGVEAEIAFNPDYVVEGLKNCEHEHVTLEFTNRTSPGKFVLGENYIYIVMPITVDA